MGNSLLDFVLVNLLLISGSNRTASEQGGIMSEQPTSKTFLHVPTKQVSSLFEEFKNFAFKGNVIDLAVGVIIGAAFGKIIDSLVKHLIMPLIGVIIPGQGTYAGLEVGD